MELVSSSLKDTYLTPTL